MPFAVTFKKQLEDVQSRLETKLYELVGELYNQGFAAERYDRVTNFQTTLKYSACKCCYRRRNS